MSHTSKDPETQIPAKDNSLTPDKDTLISEFKKLDSMLAAVNAGIQEENEKVVASQQKIEAYRSQGLQVVGQANVITRILRTMGVDTTTLSSPPPAPLELPEMPPMPIEVMPPEEEFEEVSPRPGLKNRFSPR